MKIKITQLYYGTSPFFAKSSGRQATYFLNCQHFLFCGKIVAHDIL